MKFWKGRMVVVRFDPGGICPNFAARKYNNTIHKVTRAKRYGAHSFYELDGAVSDAGVPYTFSDEDLEVFNG